jgi:hypothetical protein
LSTGRLRLKGKDEPERPIMKLSLSSHIRGKMVSGFPNFRNLTLSVKP